MHELQPVFYYIGGGPHFLCFLNCMSKPFSSGSYYFVLLLIREAAIASVKNGYFCLENLKFLNTIL